jgi:hypothetical protein
MRIAEVIRVNAWKASQRILARVRAGETLGLGVRGNGHRLILVILQAFPRRDTIMVCTDGAEPSARLETLDEAIYTITNVLQVFEGLIQSPKPPSDAKLIVERSQMPDLPTARIGAKVRMDGIENAVMLAARNPFIGLSAQLGDEPPLLIFQESSNVSRSSRFLMAAGPEGNQQWPNLTRDRVVDRLRILFSESRKVHANLDLRFVDALAAARSLGL